jgi:acyl-CoA reductase-like NAD-dependent aldehyde dehydrogenase
MPTSDVRTYKYFVDNEWRSTQDNAVFEVHEPYSGRIFARVPAGSRADARIAVDAAAKAFAKWSETPPAEKARLFLKAAEIVRRRRSEIAEGLARETGSTISFATFQMDLVAATLQQVAGWVFLPKGEVLETNLPGTHSIGVRRPLGVVASFTPWNGANVLSWRAVISPVAAGNTVVVKPSEFAPVSAGIMVVITSAAVKLIDDRVKEAVARGARVHAGAKYDGQIYYPTILTDVPLDAAIANEETFGPVVVVEAVETPEEAVDAANRTMYGLTSSILAGNTYKAFEMAPKVLAGIVNVNSPTVNDEIHAPMGGVRDSGWGRTGPWSLNDFSDVIWINSHTGQRQYPF